jgi:hypothetical protein
MSDFILQDDQNVTLAISPVDAAGNPAGAFDAGSVTATFPETSNLTAVVSADQTSVLVTALGPLTTDDVLTIAGDVNGQSVSVAFPFDVDASAPTAINVTPGTPETNAPAAAAPVADAPADDTGVAEASTGTPDEPAAS